MFSLIVSIHEREITREITSPPQYPISKTKKQTTDIIVKVQTLSERALFPSRPNLACFFTIVILLVVSIWINLGNENVNVGNENVNVGNENVNVG